MSHPHLLGGFLALVLATEHCLDEIQALGDLLSMSNVMAQPGHTGDVPAAGLSMGFSIS